MILTGPAIKTAWKAGRIVLDPFHESDLNPNSYNYHLGCKLLVPGKTGKYAKETTIPTVGYVLQPNQLYLGMTHEKIGSSYFVATLLGRSSLGRLGIFLNVTADLGHLGSCSHWTLELTVVQPVRIYPRMKIGQVSFWVTDHRCLLRYSGRYHRDVKPIANRDRTLLSAPR
jgi:dCTP deaminase